MRTRLLLLLLCFIGLLTSCQREKETRVTDFVDPFIGTAGQGHCFPGATVPFGGIQLSPDNPRSGWEWCSGYHYSDSIISSFSHSHLSGTGIGDYRTFVCCLSRPALKREKKRSISSRKDTPNSLIPTKRLNRDIIA